MARVGQARRRDANEKAIVEALERVGAVVFKLSGPGVPDILVGHHGKWLPMELKSATGKLTPLQSWGSYGENAYPIVRSVAEALALVGVHT